MVMANVNEEKAETTVTESQQADGFDEGIVTDADAQATVFNAIVENQVNEQAARDSIQADQQPDLSEIPVWQRDDPAAWGWTKKELKQLGVK